MSQTEAHVLKITLDASDVDRGLARARTGVDDLQKSATKSAGGLTLIQGGLKDIGAAEREASKALRGFTGVLGPMNGAVGQAIGGIGDLAGLLSGGGVLGIALAVAGAGVMALTKHWESLNKAQDEALERDWSRLTAGASALKSQSDRIAELNKQLRGPETRDTINQQYDEAQKRLVAEKDSLEKEISAKRTVEQNSESRRLLMLKNQEIERNEEERQKRLLILFKEQNKEIAKRSKTTKEKYGSDTLKAFYESQVSEINKDYDEREAALFASQSATLYTQPSDMTKGLEGTARKDSFPEVDAEEKKLAMMLAMREDFGFAIGQLFKEEQETYVAAAQGSVGTLAGSLQTFFTMQIEGSKYAAEVAASQFLVGIGNQLVGMSIQHGFEAAGMGIRGDPRAIPMAALAAAELSAGLGMGAGGAAIGANVSKKEARDEERARKAEERKKDRERGTGGRPSGGSGGGDGVTVVINYGVGGPPPEQTARTVARATDRANRNGYGPSSNRSWR